MTAVGQVKRAVMVAIAATSLFTATLRIKKQR